MAVEIRDLEKFSEYEDCARMQVEVWAFPEIHVVPAAHLIAMHHYGGVCAGAFEGERMVGFVFGFAGWDGQNPFHHSHMLAVLPDYRGQGLGEQLKWAQRERVLAQGVDLINWTFDPLQAPNANLNINRLGCIVRKYKVNLYGESLSPLHGGIPTDRFEAEWRIKSPWVVKAQQGRPPAAAPWAELPRANRARADASGFVACEEKIDLDIDGEALLVEIPKTITDVMGASRDLALDWRHKTRRVFQTYFEKDYVVSRLHRTEDRVFYRLERGEVDGS